MMEFKQSTAEDIDRYEAEGKVRHPIVVKTWVELLDEDDPINVTPVPTFERE